MSTATINQQDEALQTIVRFAPMIKKLFTADVYLSVSNLTHVLIEIPSAELNTPSVVDNRPLTEQDPMITAMRSNRPQILNLPKELYGMDLKIAVVPITNAASKVVGSLGISSSIQNRVDLVEIAEKFALSSADIGASTLQLTSSADHLSTYMNTISTAQSNLNNQVNDSAKILDMINTVAKSTRILGFNAGIEAARSGEHGKGFAVVAKEITKLADQSGDAVTEIRQLLDAMKEKVNEVSESVERTLEISETQSSTIHVISNSIRELTAVAEQIDELASKI
ncbi:methyl-accepting chemotaxis protein [Solibacillus sp. FSL H8-0523]|uniref:methyl-accepting chemotaxis protein n=1 Tax=Solibacillus sp. FSL H8-0523 TaxID=2954511 RepID=UPI003101984D